MDYLTPRDCLALAKGLGSRALAHGYARSVLVHFCTNNIDRLSSYQAACLTVGLARMNADVSLVWSLVASRVVPHVECLPFATLRDLLNGLGVVGFDVRDDHAGHFARLVQAATACGSAARPSDAAAVLTAMGAAGYRNPEVATWWLDRLGTGWSLLALRTLVRMLKSLPALGLPYLHPVADSVLSHVVNMRLGMEQGREDDALFESGQLAAGFIGLVEEADPRVEWLVGVCMEAT